MTSSAPHKSDSVKILEVYRNRTKNNNQGDKDLKKHLCFRI